MNSPPLFRAPSILRSCYSNYELKKSTHTPEVYRKIIHRNWKFTHKKNIRRKLIVTSISSKLKYCVQKTTIQRDVGLRIYYFAYMNSPRLFQAPSILRSCYSNYELKMMLTNFFCFPQNLFSIFVARRNVTLSPI